MNEPSKRVSAAEDRQPDVSDTHPLPPLFTRLFTEKEQKNLFLYIILCIALLEFAVTVGAIIISFTNAQRLPSGMLQPRFPWVGYLVSVVLTPVLVMLVLHLFSLGFSRQDDSKTLDNLPGRAVTFYALVRGAPAVILFAAFVLMGAAIYYLDGVMELLLKLGDSFGTIAVWLVAAFTAAWIVSYAVRAYFTYKARQMDAEYAFRREVLERTGTIMLDARYAPNATMLSASPQALPQAHAVGTGPAATIIVDSEAAPDTGPSTDQKAEDTPRA